MKKSVSNDVLRERSTCSCLQTELLISSKVVVAYLSSYCQKKLENKYFSLSGFSTSSNVWPSSQHSSGKQRLDGWWWNVVQTFTFPPGWIVVVLEILLLYVYMFNVKIKRHIIRTIHQLLWFVGLKKWLTVLDWNYCFFTGTYFWHILSKEMWLQLCISNVFRVNETQL